MREKLTIFLLIMIGVSISNESQANNWRSYLSYYQTIAIAKSDKKIFAANKNGLFSFDPSANSFETWSRVEGLSDSGISAISWSASKGALIIGYSNGNLDLLIGNAVLNLPDIKLKTTIVNKAINNILCEGDFMWLSCDFGIVKINLKKWEVTETWVIGPDANPITIRELATDERYFWAATTSGVFRADKNNLNLQDYHNWILQDRLPSPQNQFSSITVYNNRVYTCDINGQSYNFDGTSWQSVYPEITGVRKITSFGSTLLLVCDKGIELINTAGRNAVSDYGSLLPATAKINPTDALIGNTCELWIGDHLFGLIRKTGDGSCHSIVPPGPSNNNSSSLTTFGTNVYIATGNSDAEAVAVPAEIHRLKDHIWSSINEFSDTRLSGIKHITKVVPSPANPEHYWGSTSGDGLIEFEGNKTLKQYRSNNSSLETQNGTCKIGGFNI